MKCIYCEQHEELNKILKIKSKLSVGTVKSKVNYSFTVEGRTVLRSLNCDDRTEKVFFEKTVTTSEEPAALLKQR